MQVIAGVGWEISAELVQPHLVLSSPVSHKRHLHHLRALHLESLFGASWNGSFPWWSFETLVYQSFGWQANPERTRGHFEQSPAICIYNSMRHNVVIPATLLTKSSCQIS